MKELKPEQRLIVAADFQPPTIGGAAYLEKRVLELADGLANTGVMLKVNSALRACGYQLIQKIHERELEVFADLKLSDMSGTLTNDGMLLWEYKPEIVTVMCATSLASLVALKKELVETEVVGVTILTGLDEKEVGALYGVSVIEAVGKLAWIGQDAGIDGFVSSAAEAKTLRKLVGNHMTINTPNIRPKWAVVRNEDQNPSRSRTPKEAILAGVDRIVCGKPITQASNPREAVLRTIEEITAALAVGPGLSE